MSLKPLALAFLLMPQIVAAQDPKVLETLSQRSQIAVAELEAILQDCERNQRNMNICAFHDAVAAEMVLDEVVAQTHVFTPENYAALKARTQAECLAMAEDQAAGGSMMPMLVSLCLQESYNERAAAILSAGEAPVPPTPPHKWD